MSTKGKMASKKVDKELVIQINKELIKKYNSFYSLINLEILLFNKNFCEKEKIS